MNENSFSRIAVPFRLLVLCSSVSITLSPDSRAGGIALHPARVPLVRAEFERQDALVMCWDSGDPETRQTIAKITQNVWRDIRLILLVRSPAEQRHALMSLRQCKVPAHAVRFVRCAFDTAWARDYGPYVASIGFRDYLVDANYERMVRPNDDDVPSKLALKLGMECRHVPLRIDGGNLLTNGAGLFVCTSALLAANADNGLSRADVRRLLMEHYGCRQLVILDPLEEEEPVTLTCSLPLPQSTRSLLASAIRAPTRPMQGLSTTMPLGLKVSRRLMDRSESYGSPCPAVPTA